MSAHTPGPWGTVPRLGHRVYTTGKSSTLIATPGYMRDRVTEAANARLIAAAPDLLGALQMLYAETDDYQRLNNLGGYDNQCMRWARAAIAKALGLPEPVPAATGSTPPTRSDEQTPSTNRRTGQ